MDLARGSLVHRAGEGLRTPEPESSEAGFGRPTRSTPVRAKWDQADLWCGPRKELSGGMRPLNGKISSFSKSRCVLLDPLYIRNF
jgi:hypothetical protein